MTDYALTRASTVGPIADLIDEHGGSAARVFRVAGLPEAILDRPDGLMLLRDQVRLLEAASREIGDEAFAARAARAAGVAGLGPYGRHVLSFRCLGSAITIAYRDYASLMQAGTRMDLEVEDGRARWSYRLTASLGPHRLRNEILAMGYTIAVFRHFAGTGWQPDHICLPGPIQGRAKLEGVFDCAVRSGTEAAIVFPADLLDIVNPDAAKPITGLFDAVPSASDLRGVVAQMIGLELLGGQSGIGPVAERLGLARRTLQRRLSDEGTTFNAVQDKVRFEQARSTLARGEMPITEIALSLGYADSAHFTRAFRRWSGGTPREWRKHALAGLLW